MRDGILATVCGVAVFVWHFWLMGISFMMLGAAVVLSLIATGILFVAEWLGETADELVAGTGIFDDQL